MKLLLFISIFYYFISFSSSISFLSILSTSSNTLNTSNSLNNNNNNNLTSNYSSLLYAHNNAIICHQRKDYQCAIKYYKEIIKYQFDYGAAHNNLAFCFQEIGDWKSASYHHKEAARWGVSKQQKANSLAYYAYSNIYSDLSKVGSFEVLNQSIKMLKLAINIDPSCHEALFRLGFFYTEAGYSELGLETFLNLVNKYPNSTVGNLNIGNYYYKKQQYKNAEHWYLKLIQISLNNLQQNLTTSDKIEFKKKLNSITMAYSNLGSTYRICDVLPKSLNAYLQAFRYTEFANDFILYLYPLFNLTFPNQLISSISTPFQSIPTYYQIINSSIPYFVSASDSWGLSNIIAVNGLLCNWEYLEILESLMVYVINILSSKTINVANSVSEESNAIDSYSFTLVRFTSLNSSKYLARFTCKLYDPVPEYTLYDTNRLPDYHSRILRIGYYSYDWRDHPMGRLTSRFVTHHNSSKIYSISISFGPNDFSDMRRRVEKLSPLFINLQQVPVISTAAEIISSYQLDILIDLTVLTFNGRYEIPGRKPAPIIINYLGYPGTAGCRGYDYTIVDIDTLPPESSMSFDEKLIYLNHRVYQANDMPLHIPLLCNQNSCSKDILFTRINKNTTIVNENIIPTITTTIDEDLKLKYVKKDAIYLCSFNANKKLEPISFGVWMNILHQVPNTILIMMTLGPDSQSYILREAMFRGIHESRLLFLPKIDWEIHLQRSSGCDLILDTFVYGAHTTSADMLWQAVPIVTLAAWDSGKMPSRVASSLLKSLNSLAYLTITHTVQEYENVVIRLCKSPSIREAIKLSIIHNSLNSPTFNKFSMQESLESAYQQAWEVKNIFKKHSKPVYDSNDLYHRLLPHIISYSASTDRNNKVINYKMFERGKELIYLLTCKGRFIKTKEDIQELKDLIGDSDAMAIYNISQSIQSIRQRLILSNVKEKYINVIHTKEWQETLYDSCVYTFTCSMCFNNLDNSNTFNHDSNIILKNNQNEQNVSKEFLNILRNNQFNISNYLTEITDLNAYSRFLYNITTQEPNNLQQFGICLSYFQEYLYYQSTKKSQLGYVLFNYSIPLLYNQYSLFSDSNELTKYLTLTMKSEAKFVIQEIIDLLKKYSHNYIINLPKFNLQKQHEIKLFAQNFYLHVLFSDEMNKQDEVISSLISNFLLTGDSQILLILGSQFLNMKKSSIGVSISTLGVSYQHKLNALSFPILPKSLFQSNKLRVVIYCDEYKQSYWPSWNRTTLSKGGLGGSEEAVIYLAEALSEFDNIQVEVYLNVKEYHEILTNQQKSNSIVHYIPFQQYSIDNPPDIFISWRYWISLGLLQSQSKHQSQQDNRIKTKKFLWLHDLLEPSQLPIEITSYCHSILVPSYFHKNTFESYFPSTFPIQVLSNGLSNSLLQETSSFLLQPRNPNYFIYASSPVRGLVHLLNNWKTIRSYIPNAQLFIFYGYSDAVVSQLKLTLSPLDFENFKKEINQLIKQDGINYIGMVDNKNLMNAFSKSSYLLYPTQYPETGCITCLKSMSMGCIPITSKFTRSNLPYLIREYDLGPTIPLTEKMNQIETLNWIQTQYIPNLILTYQQNIQNKTFQEQIELHRQSMMKYVRKEYNWNDIALMFLEFSKKIVL